MCAIGNIYSLDDSSTHALPLLIQGEKHLTSRATDAEIIEFGFPHPTYLIDLPCTALALAMAAQEYTPAVIQALLDGPADTPPAGTTSNFNVKPPYNSQGNAIVAVCAALVVLVGGLRAYSRLRVTRTMFLEDCTSICPVIWLGD